VNLIWQTIAGLTKWQRFISAEVNPRSQRLRPTAAAGFVELPPLVAPGSASGECVVEWRDERGGQMTLRWAGPGPDLLGLAAAFWRRGR